MERKLVKQGRDALTVTLPSQWIKTKGLHAGDSVDIEIQNNSIAIQAGPRSKHTEITINIKDDESNMAWHKIISAYIDGYDAITIIHDNSKLIQPFSKSMIGMIIEEHSNKKTILKSIITIPETDIHKLFIRIGHMLVQQGILLEEITHKKSQYEDLKVQERMLDDTIYYFLRYLNKYQNQRSNYRYFMLCSNIELAADQISRIAKDIGQNKKLAKIIREHIEHYHTCLLANDLNSMYHSLRKFRNQIAEKTFVDGLAYTLAEILYNDIGYLIDDKNKYVKEI